VIDNIPYSATKEDSMLYMEMYINDWVLHQTLLATAKNSLLKREQDFSAELVQYHEKLIINEYLKKISSPNHAYSVSNEELADFLNESKPDGAPEYKDMVKLNYLKLSNPSKVYHKIKGLFFQDKDRIIALQQLESLCADTIEYYLNDEHWFYTDFIERELPFSFSSKNVEPGDKFDFVQDGYRYLVIILDKKQQLQTNNIMEDRKIALSLLQNQKRAAFIMNFQDSLVQQALLKKKAMLYPIIF